jgi:hypothetical protein
MPMKKFQHIRVTAFREPLRTYERDTEGIEESGNPDVLKLFHRHSVWMIRISVLVKVNCILVKVIGIQNYSFIDLIVPCFI